MSSNTAHLRLVAHIARMFEVVYFGPQLPTLADLHKLSGDEILRFSVGTARLYMPLVEARLLGLPCASSHLK